MFALSQLVDIPLLFQRLDALPRELATARQELWAASIEVREALAEHGQAVHDQTSHRDVAASEEAWSRFLTFQDEQDIRKDNLANLLDEMSALRAKIDLITALTLGCQETTESVLLRRLLDAVQSVPRQVEETVLKADPPPRQRGGSAVPSGDLPPF